MQHNIDAFILDCVRRECPGALQVKEIMKKMKNVQNQIAQSNAKGAYYS